MSDLGIFEGIVAGYGESMVAWHLVAYEDHSSFWLPYDPRNERDMLQVKPTPVHPSLSQLPCLLRHITDTGRLACWITATSFLTGEESFAQSAMILVIGALRRTAGGTSAARRTYFTDSALAVHF